MVARLVPNKLGAYERFLTRFADKCRDEGLAIDFLFDGSPLEEVRGSLAQSGAGISVLSENPTLSEGRKAVPLFGAYCALVCRHAYRLVSFSYCDPSSVLAAITWAHIRCPSQRPRIVWHQHSEQKSPRSLLSSRFSTLRLASGFMDAVCPVYEKGAQIMRQRHIDERKIRVLGNGVCLTPLSDLDRNRLRGQLGIAPGDFMLFSASSLIVRKNVAMMIRALAKARAENPNIVLAVAGEGDQLPVLADLARELDVSDHVRFLGLRNDVQALTSASDACLMTSWSEASPFFCMEALAAGRTLIATPAGGVSEIVQDGANGVLVGFDDHRALAREIVRITRDSGLRARFERAACETYRSRFTLDHMVDSYFDCYSRLLGTAPQLAAVPGS